MIIFDRKGFEDFFKMVFDAAQNESVNTEEQVTPLEFIAYLFVVACLFGIGFCLTQLL